MFYLKCDWAFHCANWWGHIWPTPTFSVTWIGSIHVLFCSWNGSVRRNGESRERLKFRVQLAQERSFKGFCEVVLYLSSPCFFFPFWLCTNCHSNICWYTPPKLPTGNKGLIGFRNLVVIQLVIRTLEKIGLVYLLASLQMSSKDDSLLRLL